MSYPCDLTALRAAISEFAPKSYGKERWLALFAATIATNDSEILNSVLIQKEQHAVDRAEFYEVVLQSYLFLGFPRMLTAAEAVDRAFPASPEPFRNRTVDSHTANEWFTRGIELCKKVYGANFEPLRTRVERMAPEVFHWMILEGYGKVLSRPELGLIPRELANVAMLIADDREQQLHSHMRGALNVGAPPELLRRVVEDLSCFESGTATARQLLTRLKVA